jgi:hypothetical protein
MQISHDATERERALVVTGFAGGFSGKPEPSHGLLPIAFGAKKCGGFQGRAHRFVVRTRRAGNVDRVLHRRASNQRCRTFRRP